MQPPSWVHIRQLGTSRPRGAGSRSPGTVAAADEHGGMSARTAAFQALAEAAPKDDFALVREAAARALSAIDRSQARPILDDLARHDAEPSVRKAAAAILASP